MRLAPTFVVGLVVAAAVLGFGVWWAARTWQRPLAARSGDPAGAAICIAVGVALLSATCWPPHIEYHAYIRTVGVVGDVRPAAGGWTVRLLSGPALYRCADPRCGRLAMGDRAALWCKRLAFTSAHTPPTYRCGWDDSPDGGR